MLYQLSYSRERCDNLTTPTPDFYRRPSASFTAPPPRRPAAPLSGGEGDRTPDLVNAIHALSQLSYAPLLYCRARFRAPRQHENLAAGGGSVKRILRGAMRIWTRI